MKVLEWLLGKKDDELELESITKLKKSLKRPLKIFNEFFEILKKKKELLDSIQFEGPENFFNDKKIRDRVKSVNNKLIASLIKVTEMENFDENLLKQLLIESATRLYHIADEVNIKVFNKSHQTNHVEEAKRRSYEIVKEERLHTEILKETTDEFKEIRELLREYVEQITEQTSAIEGDNTKQYEKSLIREKTILEKLLVRFRKFISAVLEKTKRVIETREIALKGKELLHMGGNESEAILFIHGYSSTPIEDREMAGYFAAEGYSVFSPRLPGHGTTEDEFYNTSMEEICSFGQQCLDYFYKKNSEKPVIISGFSLGGTVALYLASKKENAEKIKGLISINAYIKLPKGSQALSKIPFGKEILLKAVKATKKKFLRKRNMELIRRNARHIFNALNNFQFHNFDRSFEDELAKEFRQRIHDESIEIVVEQIKAWPDQERQIQEGFNTMKDKMESAFRIKYRKGKIEISDIGDITRLFEFEIYNVFSVKGIMQLIKLASNVQQVLGNIRAPLYIIQSEKDKTVDPKSANIIYNGCINASYKEIKFHKNVGHVIILEKERYSIYKEMKEFIDNLNAGKSNSLKRRPEVINA